MRDPNRIPEIIQFLAQYWQENPDLRLGQIIGNARITYHTEDDVALEKLREVDQIIKTSKESRNK
jgi:uncharacterized protein YihD (DUF1040 family)